MANGMMDGLNKSRTVCQEPRNNDPASSVGTNAFRGWWQEAGKKPPVSLLIVLLLLLTSGIVACSEATFRLADDSELPTWFASLGATRKNVTISVDYYVLPWVRRATFIARQKNTDQVLRKVVADLDGREPKVLGDTTRGYPLYEIARADGAVVVLEHRRPEPVVYITNDPAILKGLGLK